MISNNDWKYILVEYYHAKMKKKLVFPILII